MPRPSSLAAFLPGPRFGLALACALLLGGCWHIAGFILDHELEARTGPCRAAMQQVKEELGASSDVVHGETEIDDVQTFVHEWHYPERADTVVVFTWRRGGGTCKVTSQTRAPSANGADCEAFRRAGMEPPWCSRESPDVRRR